MASNKQVVIIFSIAVFLGIIRFVFLDDPEFTLIKKERIIQKISTFTVPEDMTEPMAINLEFAKYLFDEKFLLSQNLLRMKNILQAML